MLIRAGESGRSSWSGVCSADSVGSSCRCARLRPSPGQIPSWGQGGGRCHTSCDGRPVRGRPCPVFITAQCRVSQDAPPMDRPPNRLGRVIPRAVRRPSPPPHRSATMSQFVGADRDGLATSGDRAAPAAEDAWPLGPTPACKPATTRVVQQQRTQPTRGHGSDKGRCRRPRLIPTQNPPPARSPDTGAAW